MYMDYQQKNCSVRKTLFGCQKQGIPILLVTPMTFTKAKK